MMLNTMLFGKIHNKMSKQLNNTTIDASNTIARFRSRKFMYAVGLSSCSTFALFANKASIKDWIDINKFLFASYIAGNIVQKK